VVSDRIAELVSGEWALDLEVGITDVVERITETDIETDS